MAYITKDIDKFSTQLGIGAYEKQKLLVTVKHLNSFIRQENRMEQLEKDQTLEEDTYGLDRE